MSVPKQWTNQNSSEAGQALQAFVYSRKLTWHLFYLTPARRRKHSVLRFSKKPFLSAASRIFRHKDVFCVNALSEDIPMYIFQDDKWLKKNYKMFIHQKWSPAFCFFFSWRHITWDHFTSRRTNARMSQTSSATDVRMRSGFHFMDQ